MHEMENVERQETYSWCTICYEFVFFFNDFLNLRSNSSALTVCFVYPQIFRNVFPPLHTYRRSAPTHLPTFCTHTLTDALHPHMQLFTQCPLLRSDRSTHFNDNSAPSGLRHGRPEESGYDSWQEQEIYFFWKAFRQPLEPSLQFHARGIPSINVFKTSSVVLQLLFVGKQTRRIYEAHCVPSR
jgi:hypothetical protein